MISTSFRRATALLLALLGANLSAARAGELALANGAFADWKDGLPASWTVSVGARSGRSTTESRVEKGAEGGLALAGDATTGVFRFVGQRLPADPGKVYTVGFEGRVSGLRLEGDQRDNHHVALAFLDRTGRLLGRHVALVEAKEWTPGAVAAPAPAGTSEVEVGVFLSRTGLLEVRKVHASACELAESFPASYQRLVDDLDRSYSHFDGRDWAALVGRHRQKAEKAPDLPSFVAALRELLAELRDPHVWIVPPDGKLVPTHAPEVPRNFDFAFVARERLVAPRQLGRVALAGRTKGGLGYLAVGSLQGDDATFQAVDEALDSLLDAPGILLDLRGNQGGEERRAQRLASVFADARRVYAKARYRAGPGHAEFGEPLERVVSPREGRTYTRPVVCLIGRQCLSSGEGFVKMMKSFPHVTLVGQPTRGASGNPAPVTLPCGVAVFYSRWLDLLPDGTPTEGRGIEPHVLVEHAGGGDPTFDAAVTELTRRIAGRPSGEAPK